MLRITGEGTAHTTEGDRPFKPGDVIFVPANEEHQFCNTGRDACEFICLIPAPCNCNAPASK